jgi:hypothetical protein
LLDPIVQVALLAHEDLVQIAEGYVPDGIREQPTWNARVRRFHGLNELRW